MQMPEPSAIGTLGWLCRAKAIAGKTSPSEAADWLAAVRAPERVQQIFKSPVGAGPPTDTTLAPYGISLGAWSDSARTRSCFYRIVADGAFTRLPPYARIAMITSSATGAVTAEGRATAVSKLVLNNILLVPEKVTALIVCSESLLREIGPAGQQLFNRALLGAISDAIDGAFLAKITGGLTPIVSASALGDVRAAMLAVASDAAERPYFVASTDVGKLAATLSSVKGGFAFSASSSTGGELCNVPFLISSGLTAGTLCYVNAAQIAVDAAAPSVAISSEADIAMDSGPAMDSSVPTPASMTSMFSTNSVALQSSAYFACDKLRANAVSIVTGISSTTWAP